MLTGRSIIIILNVLINTCIYCRLPEIQGKETTGDELQDELTIRRLFRMAVHNEYFANLCRHPKIVSMITQLLGPDIKLLQSMALLKPPGKAL